MQDQAEQLPAVDNRTAAPPRTGMVLAFDFGVKRIGTAVGSLELGLAHPLSTIRNQSKRACFVRDSQPQCVYSASTFQVYRMKWGMRKPATAANNT